MAFLFLNQTGTIALIINSMTTNVTGSAFLTYFFIILFIVALAFAFRIPVEFTMILLLPLFIVLLAADDGSNYLQLGIAVIIYLGFILGKNLPFSR